MPGQDREGGAIFFNNRKQTPNSPDYRGELRLSQEVVQNLIQQMQSGVQFPMLDIAGWKKTSNNGTVFVSLSGKKPYEKNGNQGSGGNGNRGGQGSSWPAQGQQGGGFGGQGGGFGGGFGGGGNAIEDDIPFLYEWR